MNKVREINKNTLNNKSMPWWTEEVFGPEILGMRLLRKRTLKEMAKVTHESADLLRYIEKDDYTIPAPPPIVGYYMLHLNCKMNHVYQFRDILSGKRKDFKDTRAVNKRLKNQVYEKCNSQCMVCKSKKELHIHHVKEYSKGGRTELSNLVLLCNSCHADTHKDNKAYWLLKKGTDKK